MSEADGRAVHVTYYGSCKDVLVTVQSLGIIVHHHSDGTQSVGVRISRAKARELADEILAELAK